MLLLFVLIATAALASTGLAPVTITGQVVTDANLPVGGALIRLASASGATTANANGEFVLNVDADPVPASVRIIVSAAGFIDVEATVPISDGAGVVQVVLLRSPTYREEVVVPGSAATVPAAAPPTIVLAPLTVTRVAGAGDNVYRVLQAMPGVAAADDFGSRLAVRGGGPDQNLTIMDGVEIHNPYRLFGLTSAFNPDTIERFELTAGGFSTKWGDRLSSILLVDNREGTRNARLSGSAALSATDTNLVLEGGRSTASWLVSARRTYYDLIAERLTDNNLPSFGDLQAKGVWEPRPGHRLTLFGLASRESTDATFDDDSNGDRVGLTNDSRNDVASLTYAATIGTRTTSTTTVAAYQYRDALAVDGSVRNESTRSNVDTDDAFAAAAIVFRRDLGVRDYSMRQNVTSVLSPRQTLEAGFEAHALRTEWGWTITGDRNDNEANGSSVIGGAGLPANLRSSAGNTRAAGYVEDAFQWTPRVLVVGGARLDWSRLAGETILSPRARATIALAPRTRLKVAAGLFTQSPGYEKLIQSDYFVDLSNSRDLGLVSERSFHTIGGVEHTFVNGLVARVEAYHKTFDRMLSGRLETSAETAARVAQYDFPVALASSIPQASQITTTPDNSAAGRSYGVEAYLERNPSSTREFLTGWLSYTWGKATIDNYGLTYPFDYDRRHALSVVSTWRFIPRIDIGATLRVASGFPASTPIGVRVASIRREGTAEGEPGSVIPRRDPGGRLMWTSDFGGIDNLNRDRLPLYARLDLRFTYMRSPASRWQFYLEAINALNRDNASTLTPTLEFDPRSDRPSLALERQGALPFFPSAGFRLRF